MEEEVDVELLLTKMQGRGTDMEHLNLSYLSLSNQVFSRVTAVMRQSAAFANVKQIWLGSNHLSSIGDLQLPSCLKGIWLFSNRFDSHAALDVLLRLCKHCPEIQFVHMVRTAPLASHTSSHTSAFLLQPPLRLLCITSRCRRATPSPPTTSSPCS